MEVGEKSASREPIQVHSSSQGLFGSDAARRLRACFDAARWQKNPCVWYLNFRSIPQFLLNLALSKKTTYYPHLRWVECVSYWTLENIVSRGGRRNRRGVDARVATEQALTR